MSENNPPLADRPPLWRQVMSEKAHALMLSDPEGCKYIVEDEDNRGLFAQAIRYGLEHRDRTALRLFAEMAKFVGVGHQVAIQVWNQLNVSNEGEARQRISMTKRVETLTEEEVRATTLEWLQECYRSEGKRLVVLDDSKSLEGGM